MKNKFTSIQTKKVSVTYDGFLQAKFGKLPNTGNSVHKCYAGSLLSCNGGISKEHYISENILEKFSGIKPEGIPWMAHRTELIGPNDLTAKCLCEKHNNYLHPLDTVAGGVFDAFHNFGTYQPIITNISGPLFERWCLKVLFGILASKKVTINDVIITPEFLGQDWLEVLYFGKQLPEGTGLHSYHLPGQKISIETKVGIQTLILDENLQGLKISMAGFEFYFTLCKKEIGFKKDHPNYDYILYRPRSINKKPYPQEINFHHW